MIASLLALAVLPIVLVRSLERRHQRVTEAVEPARALISTVRLSLALGRSALRDYLITDDPVHLARYRRSVLDERASYEALEPRVARANAATASAYRELRVLEAAWHARADALLKEGAVGELPVTAPLVETDLYEQALAGAERLDREIDRYAADLRRGVATAERNTLIATVLLAALALISVVVMGRVGRRLQRYASEADRRRIEIEEVLQSKSQLVRGITHDLKNPLSAIEGYVQLMQEIETPTERQAQYLEQIHQAAGSMLEIIQRMLELARIEGDLRIEPRAVDPVDLAHGLVEQYRPSFEAAGLSLGLDVGRPPRRIRTDPARVREVLSNLLSNARKYTPPGERVDINVERARRGPRGHDSWCTIAVRDTGPGIEAGLKPRVFDEFTRGADGAATGTGLGLAIARRIARLLGGDVTLDSEPGAGSTFTLWLPR